MDGPAEDVAGAERVACLEVDRAVHLRDDEAASQRQEIDTDEIAADCGGRFERETARERRRHGRLAPPAERDVRAPLAGSGNTTCAADDLAAGDDETRSQPSGGTSSCASTPHSANQGR